MIEYLRDKYRLGRYLLWTILCGVVTGVVAAILAWLFHPPTWLLIAGVVIIALVVPNPKWVKL
jgi:predicted PurR-regulated permease PerM